MSQPFDKKDRNVFLDEDHQRGCEGRNYSCTCGYDERVLNRGVELEAKVAALSAIAPTWIARSERMPAAATYVLLTNGEWTSTGYFSGKLFLIDIQHESDPGLTPTHWMPLPSAPTDGKGQP